MAEETTTLPPLPKGLTIIEETPPLPKGLTLVDDTPITKTQESNISRVIQ